MTPEHMRHLIEVAPPETQQAIVNMYRRWHRAQINGLIAGLVLSVVIVAIAAVW